MSEHVRRIADACRRAPREASKGFVFFITNQKTIQAAMTAAAFGVISKTAEGVAQLVTEGVTPGVPTGNVTAVILAGVFAVFFWADRNTERWRDFVRDATGEDEAVEEAESEDGEST